MPDGVEHGEAVAHDPYGVSFPFQIAAYQLGLLLVVLGDHDVCAHAPDRRAAVLRCEAGAGSGSAEGGPASFGVRAKMSANRAQTFT
ncbi:hypothetical protein GCM10010284_43030 [Streptomyces rubiginosohelvolus]|uniref:Uncharacterized protein n=1 Tax=Streptomyces rubiginosohelvolus TaxID=67362 RepID=A0ABQ3BVW1_9ACTN|nr:hypothetical protein GCM10010284_43030 [Streptomyces rubiginosohelvolus]GGZ55773.1 hypothetical protein GCM10010328_33170 [Streptomyces pluricolorescens]